MTNPNTETDELEPCTIQDEIWKPVLGYDGLYEVSDWGRLKSLKRKFVLKDRILKCSTSSEGYKEVRLHNGSKKSAKRAQIHRLVIEAFIGPSDKEVNHINHDRSDNRRENLEYVTRRENANHFYHKNKSLPIGVRKSGNMKVPIGYFKYMPVSKLIVYQEAHI